MSTKPAAGQRSARRESGGAAPAFDTYPFRGAGVQRARAARHRCRHEGGSAGEQDGDEEEAVHDGGWEAACW